VCTAIYGDIPGSRFDATEGVWFVPCDVEIDVALQIKLSVAQLTWKISRPQKNVTNSNNVYPLHPLDVSPYNYPSNQTCVGSFVPQTVSINAGDLYVLRLFFPFVTLSDEHSK
jgi:saccharopepsin